MKKYLSTQIKESEYYKGTNNFKNVSNDIYPKQQFTKNQRKTLNYSPTGSESLSSHSPLSISKAKLCIPNLKLNDSNRQLKQETSLNTDRTYDKKQISGSQIYPQSRFLSRKYKQKHSQNYSQSSNEGDTKSSTKKQSQSYSQSQEIKKDKLNSFVISQYSDSSSCAPMLSSRRKIQSKSATIENASEKKDSIQLILENPNLQDKIIKKLDKLDNQSPPNEKISASPIKNDRLTNEQIDILNEYQMQKIEKIKEDEGLRAAITGLSEIRSKQNSISNTEIRSKKVSEIRSKTETQSSCCTFKSDETHQIWDNKDLEMRGIDFGELEKLTKQQQFLQFYKMRFGDFPNMKNSISNEEVVRAAINFAKTNKQMFRKYFPQKRVIFEDDTDYSKDHRFEQDPNFIKFMEYVNFIMDNKDVKDIVEKKEGEEKKDKKTEIGEQKKININELVSNRLQNRKMMKTSITKINSEKIISLIKPQTYRKQQQK